MHHRAIIDAVPGLADVEPAARTILDSSVSIDLVIGSLVFEAGQDCRQYLLIESGIVRVHLLDPDGHEIVLYRIGPGETCILTTAALLGDTPYAAYAVTETDTRALVVPKIAFESLMAQSAAFRRFVFATHGARIVDLMRVVSNVAFTRIQVRLARCLLERANAHGAVALTHEAIGVEIGTAREVVSRNLKTLERQGCVSLGQGRVRIADRRGLINIAEEGVT